MANPLKMKPWLRFFRLLKPDRKDIYYIYLFAILTGLISLTLPLGIQAIISQVMGGRASSSWVLLVVIVILGIAFAGFLQILQLTITEIIQQRIFARSSLEFALRIPRFRALSLIKYHPPELINRFFDTLTVQKGLPKILIDLSAAVIQIFFGLILLSFYHPFFVVFGLILIFLLYLLFRFTGPPGLATSITESTHKYKVAFWLEELARVFGSFKLAGNTELPSRRTDEFTQDYIKARKAHFRILIIQFSGVIGFNVLITGGLLIIGGLLVINNQINIGQFVAAEIVILLIIGSVEKIIRSSEVVFDVFTALEKIGIVTDMPLDTDYGAEFSPERKPMAVEFDRVSLQLEGEVRPSLNNLTFKINEGEKIAVLGTQESGKTLLLQTVAGLYPDVEGSISYNKKPLTSLNLESLRNRIGTNLIFEDLIYATIRENITMGREGDDDKKLLNTLKDLGLSEFIERQPFGLDTEFEPGSKGIPRGITMRLLLARALYNEPGLLLIDNQTAMLDPVNRNKVLDLLIENTPYATLVMICHDTDLLPRFDRVILMAKGEIKAEGKWEDIKDQCTYLNE